MDNEISFKKIDQRPWRKRYGKSYRAGVKDYSIIYCKDLKFKGEDVAGLCAPHDLLIYVDVEFHSIEHVIMHELLHAVITHGGFRQRPDWTLEKEEMLVDNIGEAISHNFTLKPRA